MILFDRAGVGRGENIRRQSGRQREKRSRLSTEQGA